MSSLSKVSDFGKKGQRRRIWVRLRALAEFFPPAARVGRKGGSFVPFPGAPIASMYSTQETYKLPHRLIEKKRRDRINECIAQLKDLLPEHLKLTTLGHLEKAVVLELTLKHVKALTNLIDQQQQKIIALQSGLQAGECPA